MWVLFLLIGMIVAVLIISIIGFVKNKPKYLRRGIIERAYQVVNGLKTDEFECQLEIGEIERTDTKSKVKIINYIPGTTKHANENYEKKVRKLVDNSWIESSEIEWITDSLSDQRSKKLKEILK